MSRALLIVILAIAAAACGRAEADRSLPDPQAPPATASGSTGAGDEPADPAGTTAATGSTGSTGSAGSSGSTGSTGAGDDVAEAEDDVAEAEKGDGSEPAPGTDDLKVFGFATSDEATLATELSAVAATVAALESHLAAHDLDAARADAQTLLDQAEALEADARAAEQRQRPLGPEDDELVAARKDAIAAFGLTADYAEAVTGIADAVLSGTLSEVMAAADEAAQLAGTSDDLTRWYAELNSELVAWAEANPADAARALAKYGPES